MKRRELLQALVVLPLIAAVGLPPARAALPKLWADGIHDDSDAINAYLAQGYQTLDGGTYFTRKAIVCASGTRIKNCRINTVADYVLDIPAGAENVFISDCYFHRQEVRS